MTTDNDDFLTLLRDAPMAPNVDTVRVVGVLGRTHDAKHFVLTLPNGRSQTLPVDAVKSARKMAGAIGQSVVELELEAKSLPEGVRELIQTGVFNNPAFPTGGGWKGPFDEGSVLNKERIEGIGATVLPDGGSGRDTYYTSYLKAVNDPGGVPDPWGGTWPGHKGIWDIAHVTGVDPRTNYAPFVAAMPHHVHPATLAALEGIGGRRTYFGPVNWVSDRVQKPFTDPPY
jgi:hypothetical protein